MLPSLGMRMIQNAALAFIGISAGGVIAAGVFAFLVIIGVFPRLIGKTGWKRDRCRRCAGKSCGSV